MIRIYCDKCQKEFKKVEENVISELALFKTKDFTFKISLIEKQSGHLCIKCLKELISECKVIFQKPDKPKHKKG